VVKIRSGGKKIMSPRPFSVHLSVHPLPGNLAPERGCGTLYGARHVLPVTRRGRGWRNVLTVTHRVDAAA
jgi:hypothetical protein